MEVLLIGKWRGSGLDYGSWFWISWTALVLNSPPPADGVLAMVLCTLTSSAVTHTHTLYLIYRSLLCLRLTEASIISLAMAALLFLMGWNYFTMSVQAEVWRSSFNHSIAQTTPPSLQPSSNSVCIPLQQHLRVCSAYLCVCKAPHCVRLCLEPDNDLLISRQINLSPRKSARRPARDASLHFA